MQKVPALAFGSPRKLPRADSLRGRVVVVDIAFAFDDAEDPTRYERVTGKFIDRLGNRLAMWVDHHDHEKHSLFADDPRFLIATKSEHPACPEMITPELVERVGSIDTIVCHTDFDGLCAAAKWIRGGSEPYEGADRDAQAVDTRMFAPSNIGLRMDRALRARPKDEGLFGLIVRHLSTGLEDSGLWATIDAAGESFLPLEHSARELAKGYSVVVGKHSVAAVEATAPPYFDKTLLLLLGQERADIALIAERESVSLAAKFDSGINFLELLHLSGGMPTRVSVHRERLGDVWAALGVRDPPF